ncbi:hypothetical protein ACFV9E_43550, partial [Streptomyces sp. NPDC059835]
RFALAQQKALDEVAARLHADQDAARQEESGPVDRLIGEALAGLLGTAYYYWGSDHDGAHRLLRGLAAARADGDAPEVPGRLHWDLPALEYSNFTWTPWL